MLHVFNRSVLTCWIRGPEESWPLTYWLREKTPLERRNQREEALENRWSIRYSDKFRYERIYV